MAMFLGEISFLFALSVFVAGMCLWHFGREGAARALRVAGVVAMLGAALPALCTTYYMIQYRIRGDFENAYPFRHGMGGPGMMEGMGRMMERGGMMMPIPEGEGEAAHEAHHPPTAGE